MLLERARYQTERLIAAIDLASAALPAGVQIALFCTNAANVIEDS
jgi:peroxiredoxin family protein